MSDIEIRNREAVYRYCYNGEPCTVKEITDSLPLTEQEVKDALDYWAEKGFVATKEEIRSDAVPKGKLPVTDYPYNEPSTEGCEGPDSILIAISEIKGRPLLQSDVAIVNNLLSSGFSVEAIMSFAR